MSAYAVVLTHNPETGETLHTSFTNEGEHGVENPLGYAHAFRESEEERDDFPGWLWVVTGNDEAGEIRTEALMSAMGMGSVSAGGGQGEPG